MASLRTEAQNYEPKETKNISELPKVPVDIEIYTREGTKTNEQTGQEETFRYEYVEMNNSEYRLPVSVKKQLKDHLEANPKLNYFRVSKSGSGKQTQYTVIPLSDDAPTTLKKSDEEVTQDKNEEKKEEPVSVEEV